jgi:hypothetical protein
MHVDLGGYHVRDIEFMAASTSIGVVGFETRRSGEK